MNVYTAVGKAADVSLKLTEAKSKKSTCNVSMPLIKSHRFCEDGRTGDKARLYIMRVPGWNSTDLRENLKRKILRVSEGYHRISSDRRYFCNCSHRRCQKTTAGTV